MNDADIEMHELTVAANHIARLRRKGICCHGWYETRPVVRCKECGAIFPDEETLNDERRELMI